MNRYWTWTIYAALALLALPACGEGPAEGSGGASSSSTAGTGGAGGAGGSAGGGGTGGDAGGGGTGGAPIDKAKDCAEESSFGDALTAAFGRVDGTVLAVVKPTDTQCAWPNNDHVVVQVTMLGKVYRMVVNVQSSFGDPNVRYLETTHALPAPVWEEGWHPGLMLDYANDLGVHADAFTPHDMPTLSDKIADAITLGQKISVYAHSSGGPSAHKVHRNVNAQDGAIVLDPEGNAPKVLLFRFSDQQF
ncbi:hypothetical protein [Polyangium aurulentum]|uniref:hypothetical protein n=1 Tax=Polyangium aurulentum TaxID=2567896 RepID=UPI001980349D|nr:hypothetical protein [Polyangium aurulentum]UQA60141.1 hypothetical protein E8A73_006555 [Polyangium aurulentum]